MKLGVQFYTLRDFAKTERDLDFCFYKIAQIGYSCVQLSAVDHFDAETLKRVADKYSIEIAATHIPSEDFLDNIEKVISDHKTMGCKYVGMGALPEKYRDKEFFECFVRDYTVAMKKLQEAGLHFIYHNHDFEFEKIGGKTMLEAMTEQIPADLMGITLDSFWVQAGGADPVFWFEKLKDRIPCIHLKDMAVRGSERLMAPIYEGNINFDGILNKLKENGTTEYMFVEQDICQTSPFECLETSYKNIMSRGII